VGADGLDGLSTAWFCVRSCAQPSQYVGGMVTRSVLTQVAVSFAAAALLAGCGGSDTPPVASAPSGTASATSSFAPTSTAPTPTASSARPTTPSSTTTTPTAAPLPPAAKAHSKAGAEAFVRAYFAAFNRAWTKPTAAELGGYGAATCKSCSASLTTARRLVAAHQRYDGAPVTVTTVDAKADISGAYRVSVGLRQEKRNVVDHRGKTVLTDSKKTGRFEVMLNRAGDRWRIATIRRSA